MKTHFIHKKMGFYVTLHCMSLQLLRMASVDIIWLTSQHMQLLPLNYRFPRFPRNHLACVLHSHLPTLQEDITVAEVEYETLVMAAFSRQSGAVMHYHL